MCDCRLLCEYEMAAAYYFDRTIIVGSLTPDDDRIEGASNTEYYHHSMYDTLCDVYSQGLWRTGGNDGKTNQDQLIFTRTLSVCSNIKPRQSISILIHFSSREQGSLQRSKS